MIQTWTLKNRNTYITVPMGRVDEDRFGQAVDIEARNDKVIYTHYVALFSEGQYIEKSFLHQDIVNYEK